MSEIVFNIFYVVFSIFISIIFWLKDSNKGIDRLFVSIHSVLLLITFGWAILFGLILQIHNSELLEIGFFFLLVISLVSIGISLYHFTGPKWFHLLHLWNIFALLATTFIGLMALSNDWL